MYFHIQKNDIHLHNGTQRLETNSINFNKNDLVKEDPENIKNYPPFIVNKCLAGHLDCIMFANEMNKNHQLDKDMQYSFYLNSLRKKRDSLLGSVRIK